MSKLTSENFNQRMRCTTWNKNDDYTSYFVPQVETKRFFVGMYVGQAGKLSAARFLKSKDTWEVFDSEKIKVMMQEKAKNRLEKINAFIRCLDLGVESVGLRKI